MSQNIFAGNDCLNKIDELNIRRLFVVHGSAYEDSELALKISISPFQTVLYSGVSQNPGYNDVREAVKAFAESKSEAIMAVGGGSAIDIAKCVKLFSSLNQSDFLDECKYRDNGIPLIAVPTTAGSGSESTHFAVIYKDGEKLSIEHYSLLPEYVMLIPSFLDSLPDYHKKSAFMDALCQAVESWWSVRSTEESINYSKISIKLLLESMNSYFEKNETSYLNILRGANYAGRAINITRTTAAHALSYKLSSDYNISHGHAVAVCMPSVWNSMLGNMDKVCDPRGVDYVFKVFTDITEALGCKTPRKAVEWLQSINRSLGFRPPNINDSVLNSLVHSVNIERIKNSPVSFTDDLVRMVYGTFKG